jgi:hypothetical protein
MVIFLFFRDFKCFEMGPSLLQEDGSDYYWSLPLYWGTDGFSPASYLFISVPYMLSKQAKPAAKLDTMVTFVSGRK